MTTILKPGKTDTELFEADLRVRQTVSTILDDVRVRGRGGAGAFGAV
ncbi:MAG: hypothetical protein R2873_22725 [Caldilineaceae bacterium]